uniref:Ig-like domain-containing protein n=1 Tax=Prolemur simus TaxID=1328070 RepID=A0A8C9AQG7_PROSS
MSLPCTINATFLFFSLTVNGDIVLTQTPASLSAHPGETVSISCQASADVHGEISWIRIKLGQRLEPLISHVTTLAPGVPARYSSRGSGASYVFSISALEPGDSGEYYCMHDYGWPSHGGAACGQNSCLVF